MGYCPLRPRISRQMSGPITTWSCCPPVSSPRFGLSVGAGSGATWNLNSNALRPAGWTSADAAGLPILPGLARYDEDAAGAILHALEARDAERAASLMDRHMSANLKWLYQSRTKGAGPKRRNGQTKREKS